MPLWKWNNQSSRRLRLLFGLVLFALAVATPELHAQDEDFDSYKLRIDAFWFRASPSGSIQSSGQYGFGLVDIDKDLGLDSFSTFAGKMDWKFTRKTICTLRSVPSIDRGRQYSTVPWCFRVRPLTLDSLHKANLRPISTPRATSTTSFGGSADILASRFRSTCLIRRRVSVQRHKSRPVVCNRQQGRPQHRCWPRFRLPGPNSACT